MPPLKQTNKPAKKTATRKKGVAVSNQAELDVNNPIPFEYGGQAFAYLSGQRYIPFLYPHDDFFKTLLEAKTLSLTHNACIETKKQYCAGAGLCDKSGQDFSKEVIAWLRRMNAKGESSDTLIKKAFGSFFTFGNAVIELVRFRVAGKAVLYVYVHNVREWRLAWPDKNGVVTAAMHSKLFLRQGITTSEQLKESRTVPLYDFSNPNSKKNWFTDDKGAERTVIWLKNDFDGYDYYGMPSSVSSLIYQVLEYKGARYNLDNFENNLVTGGILALRGNMGDEEASKIGKQIVKNHTGDGKRGRVMVVASEEGIAGSDYHQFNTNGEGSFLKFDENLTQKIIFANEWDAILAGISHQRSLGKGNTFLRTVYQIKKTTVIDPAQQFLIENVWTIIQQIAASWHLPDFGNYELDIKDIDPISILADVDPTPAVQVNEVRAALGLPKDPSEKGKKYLGELKAAQQQQGGGENVPA